MEKVNTRSLVEFAGQLIYVRGQVGYSRIGSMIDGEELRQENNRVKGTKQLPHQKPYTTITVNGAMVPMKTQNSPTLPESWAMSRCYQSEGRGGMCFTAEGKGKYLPKVYHAAADENGAVCMEEVETDGKELAQGSNVMLVLRVFNTPQGAGVSLDSVVVFDEEVKFFEAESATAAQIAQDWGFMLRG